MTQNSNNNPDQPQNGNITHKNGLPLFQPHDEKVRNAYATWKALPEDDRNPIDKKAFADQYNVTLRTLYNWDNDPQFQENIRFRVRSIALDYAGDVTQAIVKRATGKSDKGSAKHAELYLRHLAQIWNHDPTSVILATGQTQDMEELLTTGRFGEQIAGAMAHLKRKEAAIDAEYRVIDEEDDQAGIQGESNTDQ